MKTTHLLLTLALVFAFVAAPVLAAAPTISNVTAANITSSKASIFFNTNQTSYNSTVWYGISSPPGTSLLNATNATGTVIYLSSLEDNARWYYRVQSCNNGSTLCTNSSILSFNTLDDCAGTTLACDDLDGLSSSGTELGSFFSNFSPGLAKFLLVLAIIVGIAAILAGVIFLVGGAVKKALK